MFVHGPWYVGGDGRVQFQAIEYLDRDRFDPIAVATPNSEAWRELRVLEAAGKVRLFGIDTGVQPREARPRSRMGSLARFGLTFLQLVWLALRERVDVIHTLDRTRAAPLAVLAGRILGRGVVWHAECAGTKWGRVVDRASRVIVASNYLAREYAQAGTREDRMRMIYNGIDVGIYAGGGDGRDVRKRLGIGDGELIVLLPGRLSRIKGQMELVEAAPAILRAHANARFVLAGYDASAQDPVELGDLATAGCGTLRDILERRAAELGVAEKILFTGPTPNMIGFDAAADVVVVPSWGEPFGLVVAEAMAAGKAVVGFDAGALPELIVDGETGYLVPLRDSARLADAINTLLADRGLRRRFGESGRARVSGLFSVQVFARQLEDVFIEIVEDRSGGSAFASSASDSRSPAV